MTLEKYVDLESAKNKKKINILMPGIRIRNCVFNCQRFFSLKLDPDPHLYRKIRDTNPKL